MARKVKTAQEKKKHRKKVIIFIILFLIIIGVGGYFSWKYIFSDMGTKKVVQVNVLDSIDEYGYSISDRDTEYYESEFEILKEILLSDTVDDKAYAEQVAKMFTIDLYTMSTKINKYDVGGYEYFYVDNLNMFEQKVMDTLYSTLLDDTYGDREQDLPEVSSVETVSVEEVTYTLGEDEVVGYLVKLNIEYVSDMGYDDVASVVVCEETDGLRWSVVDFQPTLNPEYDE